MNKYQEELEYWQSEKTRINNQQYDRGDNLYAKHISYVSENLNQARQNQADYLRNRHYVISLIIFILATLCAVIVYNSLF